MVIKRRKQKNNVINLDEHRKDNDAKKEEDIELTFTNDIEASIYGNDIEGSGEDECAHAADTPLIGECPPPLHSNKQGNIPYEAIVEALKKSNGLITIAAKLLKVNYRTLIKYIHKNKKLQEHLYEIEEGIKDIVQSKLYRKIDKGDTGAMYFYLKCKAKDRGFIESASHLNPPQVPITFNYKLVMPNYPDIAQDKVIDVATEIKQIENKGTDKDE